MKSSLLMYLTIAVFSFGCGGEASKGKKEEKKSMPGKIEMPTTLEEANKRHEEFHGIGPVDPFSLPESIDQATAQKGKEIFEGMCTACHKIEKKFIGPSPAGITERRTPSWIMNMILNPEVMLEKDPIAKLLYVEYNMSPMANQNLTEEQARAVLEYFRTLKPTENE